MDTVRIACVRYLNTAPHIEGLAKLAGIVLIPTVPSRIAEMVRSGEADVGLCSLVDAVGGGEAGAAGDPLSLLPVGMIGCDGPTLTVRLFSSIALDRITAVHVDTDSHTSVILCQVLLRRLHGVAPKIVQFDARERMAVGAGQPEYASDRLEEAWPETVLLIGDKVVTDAPPRERYPHQLDLGEAWQQLTGLPFMYACWACRADRAKEARILHAAALLDRQLRHNLTRLDWIVSRRALDHRWPADIAARYLGELLRFEVGEREREAAERFVREAGELGLLPRRDLVWARVEPALAGAV